MDPADDVSLLERFVADDSDAAFTDLVLRHAPLVQATCRRRLQNEQDAADAAQAVFLILARKAPSLVRTRQWIRPVIGDWLYRVAQHVSSNHARQRYRRRHHEYVATRDAVVPPASAPSGPSSDQEAQRDHLDQAISRLPGPYRQAVVLHFLEGLDRTQTAQALRVSPEALKKRLQRAITLLRRHLGSGLDEAVLASLSTPAVTTHPYAETLAGFRAGATIPSGISHAVSGGLTSMNILLWKTLLTSLLLLCATTGAVVAAVSIEHAPPAPDPTGLAYHVPIGTCVDWGSELEWHFTPDPAASGDPRQFFVPLTLREYALWHAEVIGTDPAGESQITLAPVYGWMVRPGPGAPSAHPSGADDPAVTVDEGYVDQPQLSAILQSQQLHLLPTKVDVLHCDFDSILTYFGLPALLAPLPPGLVAGRTVALAGEQWQGHVSRDAAQPLLRYTFTGVTKHVPALYEATYQILGINTRLQVAADVTGAGDATASWDADHGLFRKTTSHFLLHLTMSAHVPGADPSAPPVAGQPQMGLVQGTLEVRRTVTLLQCGPRDHRGPLPAMAASLRAQAEIWRERARLAKDPCEKALLMHMQRDLEQPSWPQSQEPTPPPREF